MGSLNKVQLIGNVCQDPEVRHTKSGQAVTSFSLATSERWTGKDGNKEEKTEFHRIVIWGKLAEISGEYLSKGKQIYVEGKNQTREWDDKDGNKRQTTEVVCHIMTMLGQAGGSGAGQASSSNSGPPASSEAPSSSGGSDEFEEDDIPF